MVRYIVAAAGALALLSGVALAQTDDAPIGTRTVIHKTSPDGLRSKHIVIKRHADRYGNLVTKKKIVRDSMVGSSVTRSRETTDPMTGTTVRQRSTEIR